MIGIGFWICVAFVAYVYIGYPLLLGALVYLRRDIHSQPAASTSMPPAVTVLIAAFNEEVAIAAKLDNTLALDYPGNVQVLVAADGSSDRTVEIVRAYSDRGVELCYRPERDGKIAAINHAMTRATGEIVVLSDANNRFDHDVLRHLTAPFADPTVGAVFGAKIIVSGDGALGDSEGLYWRYESKINEWESRLASCVSVPGEILAVRRTLFVPAPTDFINDDYFIATSLLRRGYRVVYERAARSRERISASASDEIRRRARIFAGRFQALTYAARLFPFKQPVVAWSEISHQYMRTLLPLAMLGALVLNVASIVFPASSGGVLRLAPPYNWAALALQLGFYLAACVGAALGDRARGALKLLYVPTFLVNSNWAGLVGLVGFVTGRQTVRWKRVRRLDAPAVEQLTHPGDRAA